MRDRNETKDDITEGSDDKQIDAVVIDDKKVSFLNHGLSPVHPLALLSKSLPFVGQTTAPARLFYPSKFDPIAADH
ncbi:hypothetical protein RE628_07640 [Paenibacillus sp. D2_2]|uniref:hypothetical protein n=1 Tax=Paenibacillus sp. D2_2 TaxID=3073092 RepID=UPI002814B885|nr:hypothetical protein [Paenibacillus sp. D2_2]WMT42266.1 hypothetical protein RE628_07640 [Paenibacillus sp. D2_2]